VQSVGQTTKRGAAAVRTRAFWNTRQRGPDLLLTGALGAWDAWGMKSKALVMAGIGGIMLLATGSPARAGIPEVVRRDAPIFSYQFLEMLQYAEMHVSNAMGWMTKILYSSIEIDRFNGAGRPLHYRRDFKSEYGGYLNTCTLDTSFKYAWSDPHLLREFTVEGPCSFKSLPGEPAYQVDTFLKRRFTVRKVDETNWELTVSGENKDVRTGEVIEYARFEKPIRMKLKNRRVETMTYDGAVDTLYAWGPHRWGFQNRFRNQEFTLKRPCQRAFGVSPATRLLYSNVQSGERFEATTDIAMDGMGAGIAIDGTAMRYDLAKCYPW
jgi:hypothetical protein